MFLVKSNISQENAASSITNSCVKSQSSPEGHFKANSPGQRGCLPHLRQGSSRALITEGQPKFSPVGWRTASGGSELQGQAGPGAGGSAEAWPWDGGTLCQTWDILTGKQGQEEKGLPLTHPDVGRVPRPPCHSPERCLSCCGHPPEAHIPLQRPPLQGTAQTTTGNLIPTSLGVPFLSYQGPFSQAPLNSRKKNKQQ